MGRTPRKQVVCGGRQREHQPTRAVPRTLVLAWPAMVSIQTNPPRSACASVGSRGSRGNAPSGGQSANPGRRRSVPFPRLRDE
jgi:hypothetical protein